ncbi:MAG TPA: hypothetical protein VKV80_13445 [Streptosporangiaceae bacterium]|nr:hypothetical protein [Streptosporangiaceae bacterium]
MDVAQPIRCVIPTLDGQALEVLSGVSGSLTGREVARLARHGSESGVRRALDRLVQQGVVDAEQRGGAVFYQLNREHLAYPAVEVLAGLRRELLDRLTALLAAWAIPPLHASMFGSAARRDGDARSDIDILLVRPEDIDEDSEPWASQVEDLRERVGRWTGNRCQPYQVDPPGIAAHARVGAGIIQSWLRDAITLHGPGISSFLPTSPGKKTPSTRAAKAPRISR